MKSLSEAKGEKDEEQQGRSRKVGTVIIWSTYLFHYRLMQSSKPVFFFTLLTFDKISLPGAVCDLLCEGLVLSPSLLALI